MSDRKQSTTAVLTTPTATDLSWGEFCALVACAVAALGQAELNDIKKVLDRLGVSYGYNVSKACDALVSKRMLFYNDHSNAYELHDDGEHDEWLAKMAAIEWRTRTTAQEWLDTGIGQSTLELFPE